MENILIAENVEFSYPADPESGEEAALILKDVSMTIKKGEFVAVLGHNGSGKSTIAKHMNAILIPNKGKVYSNGIDTADEARIFDIRQHIGMVFQNPDNQIVATIVEEDVAFALENMGVPQEEMRKRVDDALKSVNMYEYREHSPSQLSGGQKQRVAIAGIIAMRPDCIVMDEPTAMLDPNGRKEVMKTIRKLNKDFGITIVIITHYMDEAALADRIIVMDNGKIIMEGIPKDIFSQVEKMKALGLDVPQVTELMYMLGKEGFPSDTHIIKEDECVDALIRILGKR
ncbi:MAG: energy-coupling factor transporter ATPase [Oscillospiraceae bacterium]